MALNLAHVAELTDYRVDSITELNAFGNDGETLTRVAHSVVSSVRDAILEANGEDRWDIPRGRDSVIHELADGLVPCYTGALMIELAVVGWAWHVDLADTAVGYDYGNYDYTSDPTTVSDAAARALYFAYRHALELLIEWAEDNAPDEDEDEDESGEDDESGEV